RSRVDAGFMGFSIWKPVPGMSLSLWRRAARLVGHAKHVARKARGLEAALIDKSTITIPRSRCDGQPVFLSCRRRSSCAYCVEASQDPYTLDPLRERRNPKMNTFRFCQTAPSQVQ